MFTSHKTEGSKIFQKNKQIWDYYTIISPIYKVFCNSFMPVSIERKLNKQILHRIQLLLSIANQWNNSIIRSLLNLRLEAS